MSRLGSGLAADDLRRHELRRAQHPASRLAIDGHVVVVADEHVADDRIKEDVAEGDVAVAEARGVQLVVAVGQLVARGGQRSGMLAPPAASSGPRCPCSADRAGPSRSRSRGPAARRPARSAKGIAGRGPPADEVFQQQSLLGGGRAGEVPLQGHRLAVDIDPVDFALTASTKKHSTRQAAFEVSV